MTGVQRARDRRVSDVCRPCNERVCNGRATDGPRANRLRGRNVVNKPNRKLMAAVSLILAAKWNEQHKMKGLLQQVERHYGLPRAVLFRSEFSVYVELGFRLSLVRAALPIGTVARAKACGLHLRISPLHACRPARAPFRRV